MILVGITLFLILIGLGFFAYGAIALSKYAFRLGTGAGLMTLLFPPYTIYFALFKLEEEGKSWPTASWLFGLVVAVLLSITFYPDLSAVMQGDMEQVEESVSAAEADAEPVNEEAAAAEQAEAEVEAEAEEAADSQEADEEGEQAEESEDADEEGGQAEEGEDAEPADEEDDEVGE